MEGPTPVSALIHAATMVTAGIYMIIRCSPLFEFAPPALMVVAFMGASTAFFAATSASAAIRAFRPILYSNNAQHWCELVALLLSLLSFFSSSSCATSAVSASASASAST